MEASLGILDSKLLQSWSPGIWWEIQIMVTKAYVGKNIKYSLIKSNVIKYIISYMQTVWHIVDFQLLRQYLGPIRGSMFDKVYWCINDCLRFFWELLLYPICDLIYRNYSTRMSRYIVNECMNLISLWLLFLRWALWLIGLVSVISLFEDNTFDPSKFTILKYFRNSSL